MRTHFKSYMDTEYNEYIFAASIVFGLLALISVTVGIPVTVDVGGLGSLFFLGLLPGAVHLYLYATNVCRGLTDRETSVFVAYQNLPAQLRKEFTLSRETVRHMGYHDRRTLVIKMEELAQHYYVHDSSQLENANNFLDAALEVYGKQ